MIKNFKNKSVFFILLIFLIDLIIFFVNYKKNTFLIGWDNLYPELNFKLDFFKNLFAVWQEYRGLGLIDGMSHSTNLFHTLERFIISLFFPLNLIRWIFIFLSFFAGGVGTFFFLKKLTKNNLISFLGSLFYQLNFYIIQQYFLPFEVFLYHFSALPWLYLSNINFLENPTKKNLLIFSFLSLIFIPQAHVPTLFLVYVLGLLIINLFCLKKFKQIILILTITFSINSFWLLPYIYQTFTNSKNIANSKTFQMSSNDIFYRNKKYANLLDIIYMKSLTIDFKYLNTKKGYTDYMMSEWRKHIDNPFYKLTCFVFFGLAILGIFKILKNKQKNLYPFLALYLFSFTMIATDIPIFGLITDLARKYIPLFATIFRFTFTKFSIIYAFSYSIMIAIGLSFLIEKIKNYNYRKLTYLIIFLIIIYHSLPSFKGQFFYENLAVKIPDEYFQVFDFFQKQNKNERVAILPIPWYWAWVQPKWGTINSGFIWYGILQPITDLAFTPWGVQNENFYWEIEQAIFSQNAELLKKVLKKYDISWIYLDKNIVNNTGKKIDFDEYEKIIFETNLVEKKYTFKNIIIFQLKKPNLKDFVSIKNNLIGIAPSYNYNNLDQGYLDFEDYYIDEKNPSVYYPFRNLFSGKSPKDFQYQIKEDENLIYFISQIPSNINWRLNEKKDEIKKEILIDKNTLKIKLNKKDLLVYNSKNDPDFINQENNACEKNSQGKTGIKKDRNNITLTSINSHNCVKVNIPQISLRNGYLVKIQTKNDKIRGFFINFVNNTSKKNDLETYLDNDGEEKSYYFITTPRGFYEMGYTIYFDNISEGKEKISNTLKSIEVYQIPYDYLKSLSLLSPQFYLYSDRSENRINDFIDFEAKKINYFTYEISNLQITNNQYPITLYLSQSYHPGWKAYVIKRRAWNLERIFPFIFGKELKDHVMVNNWANGWRINSETWNLEHRTYKNNTNNYVSRYTFYVILLFWPQYLQFLGFGILIITFVFILKFKH